MGTKHRQSEKVDRLKELRKVLESQMELVNLELERGRSGILNKTANEMSHLELQKKDIKKKLKSIGILLKRNQSAKYTAHVVEPTKLLPTRVPGGVQGTGLKKGK